MNKQTGFFDEVGVQPRNLGEVIAIVERVPMSATRRRDLVSAVKRFCQMARMAPDHFAADVGLIRERLSGINPVAEGISGKSLANIVANLKAALGLADVIDGVRPGLWKTHADWNRLIGRRDLLKRLSMGLANSANYCALHDVAPSDVSDETVLAYHAWLIRRTIDDDPDGRTRLVPRLVAEARSQYADWPIGPLSEVTIGLKPKKTAWHDLPEAFRHDAEAWLDHRQNPDPFDETEDQPARAISKSTARLHREYLRLAWHILNEAGNPPANLTELVEPERFKSVLRHYHEKAGRKASATAETVVGVLKSIARYHVRVPIEHFARHRKLNEAWT